MLIDLQCEVCGNSFQRNKSEVSRNAKVGRKTYCSLNCSGKAHAVYIKGKQQTCHLIPGNRQDDYSMVRVFMARIRLRHRDRGKEYSVTLQDLKEQWELQKGVCPYTGWNLITPRNTKGKRHTAPDTASLDRIDSSKGYIKGNVEFVSLMAQHCKNQFSKEDVLKFCEAVVKIRL